MDLFNSDLRDSISEAFDNIHDTYKVLVDLYSKVDQNSSSDNPIFGHEVGSKSKFVKTQIYARVRYLFNHGDDKFAMNNNMGISLPDGTIRFKILKTDEYKLRNANHIVYESDKYSLESKDKFAQIIDHKYVYYFLKRI